MHCRKTLTHSIDAVEGLHQQDIYDYTKGHLNGRHGMAMRSIYSRPKWLSPLTTKLIHRHGKIINSSSVSKPEKSGHFKNSGVREMETLLVDFTLGIETSLTADQVVSDDDKSEVYDFAIPSYTISDQVLQPRKKVFPVTARENFLQKRAVVSDTVADTGQKLWQDIENEFDAARSLQESPVSEKLVRCVDLMTRISELTDNEQLAEIADSYLELWTKINSVEKTELLSLIEESRAEKLLVNGEGCHEVTTGDNNKNFTSIDHLQDCCFRLDNQVNAQLAEYGRLSKELQKAGLDLERTPNISVIKDNPVLMAPKTETELIKEERCAILAIQEEIAEIHQDIHNNYVPASVYISSNQSLKHISVEQTVVENELRDVLALVDTARQQLTSQLLVSQITQKDCERIWEKIENFQLTMTSEDIYNSDAAGKKDTQYLKGLCVEPKVEDDSADWQFYIS